MKLIKTRRITLLPACESFLCQSVVQAPVFVRGLISDARAFPLHHVIIDHFKDSLWRVGLG
jgi:hypothetical protein